MSKIILAGSDDGVGSVTVVAPNTNSNQTLTLENATGTLAPLVLETAKTATGTAVDFTGIPSWVKRITVSLSGVSGAAGLSGAIQLGVSGGLVTTGYVAGQVSPPGATYNALTYGIVTFGTSAAASTLSGIATITHLGNNIWSAISLMNRTTDNVLMLSAGTITLAGVINQVSVITQSSTFDAGTINIMYE
jgi:hypothetical protein